MKHVTLFLLLSLIACGEIDGSVRSKLENLNCTKTAPCRITYVTDKNGTETIEIRNTNSMLPASPTNIRSVMKDGSCAKGCSGWIEGVKVVLKSADGQTLDFNG